MSRGDFGVHRGLACEKLILTGCGKSLPPRIHDGLTAIRWSVFRATSPLLWAVPALWKSSQSNHAGAVLLDQPVEYGDRVALPPVEQGFRSRNQIRQPEAHQAIARSRLQQFGEGEADVRPHIRIVVHR